MISGSLALKNLELTAFYATGVQYYGKNGEIWDFDYFEDLRELGFISGRIDDGYYVFFPSKADDLKSFVNVLFGDEEEFLDENQDFPLVIQKYNLIKKMIADMGFRLELLNK